MEFLKGILSEDTYTKLSVQLGEDLTKQVGERLKDFTVDPKAEKMIPKVVFDSTREKSKALQDQLTERDNQLIELQKQVKGNADFELKLKELQETNTKATADYEIQIKELSQNYAFKEALNGYKPKNSKALEALVDKSKLVFKDESGQIKVDGLDEQVEALKKSDSYLFGETESGTKAPNVNPTDIFGNTNNTGLAFDFAGVRAKPKN
jgi:hypothetical protein